MAINVSIQHNGGLLPDIILFTQGYYHRESHLNAIKMFCLCTYTHTHTHTHDQRFS